MTQLTSVTDEQLGRLACRQHDLFRRVREGTIDMDVVLDGLQRLIESSAFVTIEVTDMSPLTPPGEGWELVEDVTEPIGTLTLELILFHLLGEDWVKGTVMQSRVKELNARLGERHARALLAVRDRIPEKWRSHYIPFPGTLWRGPSGYLRVPFLGWRSGEWILDFHGLESDFRSDVRLARPRT